MYSTSGELSVLRLGIRCRRVRLAAWKMSERAAVAERVNGIEGGGRGHVSVPCSVSDSPAEALARGGCFEGFRGMIKG